MTKALEAEIAEFRRREAGRIAEARQRSALFIVTGIDLDDVLAGGAAARNRARGKLRRLIERERMKGAARHWSYDLNRHIALKSAYDRIGEE